MLNTGLLYFEATQSWNFSLEVQNFDLPFGSALIKTLVYLSIPLDTSKLKKQNQLIAVMSRAALLNCPYCLVVIVDH